MLMTWNVAPHTAPAAWSREDRHAVRADVRHDVKNLTFVLDVPGVRRADVDIHLENGVLSIRGVRHAPQGAIVANSAQYGSFQRCWRLPENADVDNISASLESGVLTVVVPKAAASGPRRIPIEAREGDWWSRARKWLRDTFR
jgi:HSP20 family protein